MFEGLKKKCSYQQQALNELCVWCTFGYCGGVRFNHTKYFSVLIMMLLVDQIPCCHQFIGMHLNHHWILIICCLVQLEVNNIERNKELYEMELCTMIDVFDFSESVI